MQSKYWLDVEMASTMLLCILCNNISWVLEFLVRVEDEQGTFTDFLTGCWLTVA